MDIYRLSYWLDHALAPLVMIDGLLFFKDSSASQEGLRQRIERYPSPEDAQAFMNTVFLEDFISEACGNGWESDDPSARQILATVKGVWSTRVRSDFPGVDFAISEVIDDDVGDFGLCLRTKVLR